MNEDRRIRREDIPEPRCALDISPEDFDAVAMLDEPAPAAVPDIPVIVLLLPWWPA